MPADAVLAQMQAGIDHELRSLCPLLNGIVVNMPVTAALLGQVRSNRRYPNYETFDAIDVVFRLLIFLKQGPQYDGTGVIVGVIDKPSMEASCLRWWHRPS